MDASARPPQEPAAIEVRGLRHLALRVADVERTAAFYQEWFGLRAVWRPDERTVFLTSGTDSLALLAAREGEAPGPDGSLDHLGFLVAAPGDVEAAAAALAARGVALLEPPTRHRDGSFSCSCRDPDGTRVQIIYIPGLEEPGGASARDKRSAPEAPRE